MGFKLPTTATHALRIARGDVPPTAMAAAALFSGIESGRVAEAPAGGDLADSVVTLLDYGSDRGTVADALTENTTHVVELSAGGDAGQRWLGVFPGNHGFYLSLTTATAYPMQPAVLVCDELLRRGVLAPDKRAPVELCLHEAVANGLIHGNLEVCSAVKDGPDGHRVFNQFIIEGLRDSLRGQRRLDMFIRWDHDNMLISVCDEGGGFNPADIPSEADRTARSGRGFLFMRALSDGVDISDGGRCTTLRFRF